MMAEVKECLTTHDLPRLQNVLVVVAELTEYIEENPDSCRTYAEELEDSEKVTPNQVSQPRLATVQKRDRRIARGSEEVTS
jgi:hypothetical protein